MCLLLLGRRHLAEQQSHGHAVLRASTCGSPGVASSERGVELLEFVHVADHVHTGDFVVVFVDLVGEGDGSDAELRDGNPQVLEVWGYGGGEACVYHRQVRGEIHDADAGGGHDLAELCGNVVA